MARPGRIGALSAFCQNALDPPQPIGRASQDRVVLWLADLDAVPERVIIDAGPLFSTEELASEGRLPEVRRRLLARRLLRRVILAAHARVSVDQVQITSICERCGDPSHGRPILVGHPRIHFASASSGASMVLAQASSPLGVDIEEAAKVDVEGGNRLVAMGQRWWPATMRAVGAQSDPLQSWTGIEALAKAIGLGLVATDEELLAASRDWSLSWTRPEPGLLVALATSAGANGLSPPAEIQLHDLRSIAWDDSDPDRLTAPRPGPSSHFSA